MAESLQFQLERLSAGREFAVTALEPATVEPVAVADVRWVTSRFEDYHPDCRFDWISVRHSFYYLTDPIAEIARLTGMLTDGGMLALTHWARHCILHKLHVELCGDHGHVACGTIEDIVDAVGHHGIEHARLSLHDADLDIPRVLADSSLLHALYVLVCRGRPVRPAAAADPRATIARVLKDVRYAKVRKNGILLLQARPN